MADFYNASMRFYVEHMVDWQRLLELRGGDDVDPDAEVGAYRSILETAGELAASFQPEARAHWSEEATLTSDGGATSPPHIVAAYEKLRAAGLVSTTVSEAYGARAGIALGGFAAIGAALFGWYATRHERAAPAEAEPSEALRVA